MFYYRFLQSAERWPNAIAIELQHEGSAAIAGASPVESYTFADLRQMAESVGQWLLQRGTKRGSHCALLAANHPRWVAAYLGILASGNTAVPLDTAFHAEQVRKLLLDSDSVLLFCDTRHLPVAHEAVAETSAQIVLLDPVPEKALFPSVMDMFAAGPGDFKPVTPEAHEIGAILYTSGTTSDPKGVMLSHANWVSLDQQMGANVPDAVAAELYTVRDVVDAVLGTSEIFGGKLMQRIGEKVRLIPIDPDSNLVPAMRAGAYGLRHGRVLVLFPEGERSIDAVPKTFRKGAAILAIHTRCPVVPVAIEGFHEAWPRGERFRRFAKLRVRILDPVEPPEPGPILEEQYSAMTAEIRQRVVKAWGELHAAAQPWENS